MISTGSREGTNGYTCWYESALMFMENKKTINIPRTSICVKVLYCYQPRMTNFLDPALLVVNFQRGTERTKKVDYHRVVFIDQRISNVPRTFIRLNKQHQIGLFQWGLLGQPFFVNYFRLLRNGEFLGRLNYDFSKDFPNNFSEIALISSAIHELRT